VAGLSTEWTEVALRMVCLVEWGLIWRGHLSPYGHSHVDSIIHLKLDCKGSTGTVFFATQVSDYEDMEEIDLHPSVAEIMDHLGLDENTEMGRAKRGEGERIWRSMRRIETETRKKRGQERSIR
jgi:hypothetical protein